MSLKDILVLGIIATLIGAAVWKLISDKKKGVKCSGCSSCPSSESCASSD